MKVEFEHRRVDPAAFQVTVGSQRVPEPLARQLALRIRVTRWLVLVAGAAGVAWVTRRYDLELTSALCVFLGALPVLWVLGWLAGLLLHMRRTTRQFAAQVGSTEWQKQAEAATHRERVALEVLDTGLQVSKEGGRASLVGFQRVSMHRQGPELLVVNVAGELFQVPGAAFPDPQAFDAFCLELQRHLWNAERSR